ncbi:hypothetical protein ACT6QH_08720 [Xanthobacter sp. TB0139]|uniref:hypothetical protein n=1 Tax=Xanthobacter sp. TB0139 TaxID=3459178 RepID=UPI004039FB24
MMSFLHRHMSAARKMVLALLIAFGPWLGAGGMLNAETSGLSMVTSVVSFSDAAEDLAFTVHVPASLSGKACLACNVHEKGAAGDWGNCDSLCQSHCQGMGLLASSLALSVPAPLRHDFPASTHPESVAPEVAAPPPRMAA